MKEHRLAVSRWSVISILCILLLSGCPQTSSPSAPPPTNDQSRNRPQDVEHRIAYSGETLAIIANWYTGKSTNWPLIRDANPGLRPERLNLGQIVRIPGDLVVERNPMPRKVLQGSGKRTSGKSSIPTEVTSADENPPSEPVVDTNLIPDTPPPETSEPNAVDLEQLLKEQIEAQKKNTENETPPVAVEEKKPEPTEPSEGAKAPAEKAPSVPGDSEREQLLDELLTQ